MMIKILVVFLQFLTAWGINYNSSKYFKEFDILKISKFENDDNCYQVQKTSENYFGLLKINEALTLQNDDVLKCYVTNAYYNVKKTRMVIHTMGSTSDPSSVTKFSNPTDENCFSFFVRTSGRATVYLYEDLNIFKYKILTLGIKNNTHSLFSDNDRTCTSCSPHKTIDILSPSEFRGFWISWNNDEIKVGKEGENTTLFSNKFYDVGTIRYIGLSTPGSLGPSTWRVEEPMCPEILYKSGKEINVVTRCHKIFDEQSETITKHEKIIQLLKKAKALQEEFNVEVVENQITLNRIEHYYYPKFENFYFKNYIKLIQNCKNLCDEETLKNIGEILENVRIFIKHKTEELASKPLCSENGYFDDVSQECVCNKNYAGDGFSCAEDTDNDGFPDETILDCINNSKCKKDNCPRIYNPYQDDYNNNGVGDLCEKYFPFKDIPLSDENQIPYELNEPKIYCANVANIEIISGANCILESDFVIPNGYDEKYLDIIFSQKDSDKSFIISWNDFFFGRFSLIKLDNEDINTNNLISHEKINEMGKLWSENNRNYFEVGRNYRIVLFYALKKLQIRILDANGTIVESRELEIDEIDTTQIHKLCSISGLINWASFNHQCY